MPASPTIDAYAFLQKWAFGQLGPDDVVRMKADVQALGSVCRALTNDEKICLPKYIIELFQNDNDSPI